MVISEIQDLCKSIAQDTTLPYKVVLAILYARAGRPCNACGGYGRKGGSDCTLCLGSGGPRGTRNEVEEAALWVRRNVQGIQAQIDKKEREEIARKGQKILEIEMWKKQNAHLCQVVADLLPGLFKTSLEDAIEEGRLTEDQIALLEQLHRKKQPAPPAGSEVAVLIQITSCGFDLNPKQQKYFRINFEAQPGWVGRIETSDPALESAGHAKASGMLKGTVAWSKDRYAILKDPLRFTPKDQ